jgi:hypothetical protein
MKESGKISALAASFSDLTAGTAYPFSEWPNPEVPTFGAGVYTIWHHDGRFIYVGMSGRDMTADTANRNKPQGIYTRLKATPVVAAAVISFAFMWLIDCPGDPIARGHHGNYLRPPSNGCSCSPVHSRKPFLPLCDPGGW